MFAQKLAHGYAFEVADTAVDLLRHEIERLAIHVLMPCETLLPVNDTDHQ